MFLAWYAPPIVFDGAGTIPVDGDEDEIAEPCQRFVHGIIHNLVYQVMKTPSVCTPDVHGRAFSYWFQALQDRDLNAVQAAETASVRGGLALAAAPLRIMCSSLPSPGLTAAPFSSISFQ